MILPRRNVLVLRGFFVQQPGTTPHQPCKNILVFALSDGVCKINDSTPRRNILVCAGFLVCNVYVGKWNTPGLLPGFTPGVYWFPKFQHLCPRFTPGAYLALKFQLCLIFSATKYHEKQNFLLAGAPTSSPECKSRVYCGEYL